jgi:tRNA modification GTPase
MQAIETIKEKMPVDIISVYIKQALEDLGEITGNNVSDDIINEIFKKFCLGK